MDRCDPGRLLMEETYANHNLRYDPAQADRRLREATSWRTRVTTPFAALWLFVKGGVRLARGHVHVHVFRDVSNMYALGDLARWEVGDADDLEHGVIAAARAEVALRKQLDERAMARYHQRMVQLQRDEADAYDADAR